MPKLTMSFQKKTCKLVCKSFVEKNEAQVL